MHTTQERPEVALGATIEVTEAGRAALGDLQVGGCEGCQDGWRHLDDSIAETRLYRVVRFDGSIGEQVRYCAYCVETIICSAEPDQVLSVQLLHPDAPESDHDSYAVFFGAGLENGQLARCETGAFGFVSLELAMHWAGSRSRAYTDGFVVVRGSEIVWGGRLIVSHLRPFSEQFASVGAIADVTADATVEPAWHPSASCGCALCKAGASHA